MDAVLQGLKYRRLDYLGPLLAAELSRRFPIELAAVEVVVPVPLHWRRRLQRGYNQAESIARPLAERLGVPMTNALVRSRATLPQTRLPRVQRARNLAHVFRLKKRAALEGRKVLLVDDVFTTGATLRGAAEALGSGGARVVYAMTAARTPREGG